MEQIRVKISADDQSLVLSKIVAYKEIHEEISKLEEQLSALQDRKDMLLTDLSLARADEDMLLADLEMKYGPGKLDARNMEWVEKINTMNDEFIERI